MLYNKTDSIAMSGYAADTRKCLSDTHINYADSLITFLTLIMVSFLCYTFDLRLKTYQYFMYNRAKIGQSIQAA